MVMRHKWRPNQIENLKNGRSSLQNLPTMFPELWVLPSFLLLLLKNKEWILIIVISTIKETNSLVECNNKNKTTYIETDTSHMIMGYKASSCA